MTDEPVVTSLYCTNWGGFNTPRLWAMVEHEDDEPSRRQVSAWRTLAGSVRSQQEALKTARADLVAAWPPEQNQSSAAFVQELDILIGRLDSASADADATASGLDNIVSAIQTAKTKLKPLWEQYKDKSSDLIPHWWDKAEDGIDSQARNAMIEAERAVEDSVSLLKVPEPYQLRVGQIDEEDDGSGRPVRSAAGGGHRSTSRGIDVSVPHDPPPPMPGHDTTVPGGNQGGSTGDGSAGSVGGGGGPGLAGVITPGPPPGVPGGGQLTPLPTGGGGGLPTGGSPINPVVPGLLPTGGGAPIAPGSGLRPGRLTQSGVLGEPGAGVSRGSPVGRSGRQPRPSWLSDDEVGPDRNRGTGMSGMPGRGGRRGRSDDQLAFDPDNPWAVAEGVEPVIAPSTDKPRHDPGPTVIGWR
ncbi:hypothetical protein ODJ79_43510 [Actinoplanes sp. KI2]|uniref:hypothetical protein n=1 Tax=Actinoplanes sp. KI2 TaxID=2983315 RepID=UPI0021D596E4|nr:hypothetical protein [Actinoplanes sp. KI2]MCU7730626.1 hypothetical protein [Actinoplanes sp. KI2]